MKKTVVFGNVPVDQLQLLFKEIKNGCTTVATSFDDEFQEKDRKRVFKYPLLERMHYYITKDRIAHTGTIIAHIRNANEKPYVLISDEGIVFYANELYIKPVKKSL